MKDIQRASCEVSLIRVRSEFLRSKVCRFVDPPAALCLGMRPTGLVPSDALLRVLRAMCNRQNRSSEL